MPYRIWIDREGIFLMGYRRSRSYLGRLFQYGWCDILATVQFLYLL